MPRPETSFEELQHVAVKVSDIEESLKFYTGILGFTLSERHDPDEHPSLGMGLCFLRCSAFHHDLNLVYHTGEQPALKEMKTDDQGPVKDLGLHHFAFRVKDRSEFFAWRDWLEECGVKIVRGPVVHSPSHPEGDGTWGENRAMYFCDPDGHRIEIFCDLARMDEANGVEKEWYEDRLRREGIDPAPHPPVGPHPTGALTR